MKLRPLTLHDIDEAHAEVEALTTKVVDQVLRDTAHHLRGDVITENDLTILTRFWNDHVDELAGFVSTSYHRGADASRHAMRQALERVLTAGPTVDDFSVPVVSNEAADQLLTNARNRLVRTGNDVWEATRQQLVEGMQAGEGTALLRERVMNAGPFAAPRALTIARSEVGHAMNQGSIAQMRELDVPVSKEWIAVDDSRTRPEHAEVDGEKVSVDGVFSIGFDPGDDYNCRCTTGFDIPDEDAFVSEVTGTAGVETAATGDDALALVPAKRSLLADVPRSAVQDYTTQGYDWTNFYLRESKGDLGQIMESRREQIQAMDAAMQPTTGETRMYRGIADPREAFGSAWSATDDLTGMAFTDHAYISTSAQENAATSFAGNNGGVLLDVQVPPGTPALANDEGGEAEVILGRGQHFKVVADQGWVQSENLSRSLTKVRRLQVEVVHGE